MASGDRASGAVAAALVASVFVVDPGGLAPSGPARFAALAAVLGVGAVVVAAGVRRLEGSHVRPFVGSWSLLLVLIASSVVAGADRWHGVFGSSERNLGLLTWIGFGIAFFVGAALPPRSETVLAASATIAVAGLSGLALLERLGFDPTDTAWLGDRVGTPFAQSTYLAVALVVLGPLVAGAALDPTGRRPRRVAAAVVTVAGLSTLVATQSRGPMLGLGLASIVVLVFRGRPLVGALVGGGAAASVVGVSFARGWRSFGGRLDEWRVGLRGVQASPILGFGPEGYRDEFPRLVDAAYVRAHGSSVITDRAHNGLIDTALSSGVIAALVLGSLWLLIGRAVAARVREDDVSAPVLGLAVGVLAGLGQQLVLFPLAEIDPIIWMLGGALVGGVGATTSREPMTHRVGRTKPPLVWLGGSIGVAAMVVSFWWNLSGALGEHRLAQSTSFRQDRAEVVADAALALRPQSVRLAYATAAVHANGPTLLDLDEAISILEAALARHPGDPALRTEYVFRLVERARRSGLPDDVDRAIEAADDAITDAPMSPQLRGAGAEALLLDDQRDEAQEQVLRALELDPDDPRLQALADSIEKS